jgi:hypothetical protein
MPNEEMQVFITKRFASRTPQSADGGRLVILTAADAGRGCGTRRCDESELPRSAFS